MLRTLLPALLLVASSGCIIVIDKTGGPGGGGTEPYPGGGGGTEPYPVDTGVETGCTDIAYSSVVVDVVDPNGAPLSGADVTWTPTGSGATPEAAQCANDDCTEFVAGWEVSGAIDVMATLHEDTEDPCCWVDDTTTSTVEVPLTADGCHVLTQYVTLTLDPSLMTCADDCG